MIKLVLIAAIATMSQNTYSQVSTGLLSCNGSGFPFTVQFFGKTATATFKGYAHTALYARTFIGKNGDTWFVYRSQTIDISVVPNDKYVALYAPDGSTILAGAICN